MVFRNNVANYGNKALPLDSLKTPRDKGPWKTQHSLSEKSSLGGVVDGQSADSHLSAFPNLYFRG